LAAWGLAHIALTERLALALLNEHHIMAASVSMLGRFLASPKAAQAGVSVLTNITRHTGLHATMLADPDSVPVLAQMLESEPSASVLPP
jgi:hypothetical protein